MIVTVSAGVGPDISYVVDTRIGNWAELGLRCLSIAISTHCQTAVIFSLMCLRP